MSRRHSGSNMMDPGYTSFNQMQQQPQQEPLVLDPSCPPIQPPPQEGMMLKFLHAATSSSKPSLFMKQRKDTELQHEEYDSQHQLAYTAAKWAQDPTTCQQAGYLLKLGTRIVEFKRRFFVLTRPISYLYYFLSPQDAEPRGCINLQNAKIRKGSGHRLEVALSNNTQVIVLEARSEQVQQEWLEAFGENHESCLDHLEISRKNEQEQSRQIQEMQNTIRDLRQSQQNAEETAKAAETKLQHLEQGIRLLTRHVTVQNETTTKDETEKDNEADRIETIDNVDSSNNLNESQASHRERALLDSVDESTTAEEDLLAMDQTTMPASFSSLFHACNQLKQFADLSADEASTAVQDLYDANESVEKLQKRMTKAEQYLYQLWQDNCNQRKTVKKLKQEKKLLVKEVKSLMVTASSTVETTNEATTQTSTEQNDDEQLLNELEEHVMTSIKLHEELLAGNAFARDGLPQSVLQKSATPVASLMDDDSFETDDDSSMAPSLVAFVQGGQCAQESIDMELKTKTYQDRTDSNSVREYAYEADHDGAAAVDGSRIAQPNPSQDETFQQEISNHDDDSIEVKGNRNPLVVLDDTDDESEQDTPVMPAKQSLVTDNGKATSRLISPLADVGQEGVGESNVGNDGRVYHLSFHSRKIGIQFQKVPLPRNAQTGLLTQAMTSDLGPVVDLNGQEKTASELQRIASISSLAKDQNNGQYPAHFPVAGPVDAVLVCGLVGFDHSANPTSCPKLGARLVAFDGVSVEVGRWTFDSVRKAIQSRGRPLTLSFRDDMLTTQQREVLTKAISDVKSRTTRTVQEQATPSSIPLPPSTDSEPRIVVESGHIHEVLRRHETDDQSSVSTMASVSIASDRQSLGGGDRVPSRRSPYSFSEAGSSSVASAALGPLMANIMSGLSSQTDASQASRVPNYLRNDTAESIEHIAQHRQFEESLL